MHIRRIIRAFVAVLPWAVTGPVPAAGVEPSLPEVPADYFAEPANLPFDVQVTDQGREPGWHWQDMLYTSLVYQGEPVRVHAIYALPNGAGPDNRVPILVCTHGADTGTRGTAGSWYWRAITTFAKAGYGVFFYDWDSKPTPDWDPAKADVPRRFTHYGKLNYLKTGYFSKGNDYRDGMHYQVMMAGKRGLSWVLTQPEVDTAKVGAWGASYGGIFTSMLFGIEPRIKAANPAVYTADFGLGEESYNKLPGGWTEADAQGWRVRFDSFVLLAKRPGPILYTVGANDTTFLLTKANRMFAAMSEPKHFLIGPNQGHGYWDLDQTVLFFDDVLRGRNTRPEIRDLRVELAGREVVASATVRHLEPGKGTMEFFGAQVFECDPDRGAGAVTPDTWQWTAVEAVPDATGHCVARWPLAVMRPPDPKERILTWGETAQLDPQDPKALVVDAVAEDKLQGIVHVFARAKGAHGAMECSPVAADVPFADPPAATPPAPPEKVRPVLEAAVRIAAATVVAINPSVPAGQPVATFSCPLPAPAVGTHGYVLWNWRQKPPTAELAADTVATPTKKILAPFVDTVKAGSFTSTSWGYNAFGALTSFAINGVPDRLHAKGRAYYGALHNPGSGGLEELPIEVQDDQEHRLTLVVPACQTGTCHVRVSLSNAAGETETIRYRHTADRDQIFQFRFTGKAVLRIRMTSQPLQNYMTLVGPSALFLD